jgi:hypothetical protein
MITGRRRRDVDPRGIWPGLDVDVDFKVVPDEVLCVENHVSSEIRGMSTDGTWKHFGGFKVNFSLYFNYLINGSRNREGSSPFRTLTVK